MGLNDEVRSSIYKRKTSGMTESEARSWWAEQAKIELDKARRSKGKYPDDLGPDIPYSHHSRDLGRSKTNRVVFEDELDEYPVHGCIVYNRAKALLGCDDEPLDWMPNPFRLRNRRDGA